MSSAQTWLARSMASPRSAYGKTACAGCFLLVLGLLAVQRLDAHAPHLRAHVPPSDLHALQAQQIPQHAAAGIRVIQVKAVDAPHERQFRFRDRRGVSVQTTTSFSLPRAIVTLGLL